jgi:hypothetical protein
VCSDRSQSGAGALLTWLWERAQVGVTYSCSAACLSMPLLLTRCCEHDACEHYTLSIKVWSMTCRHVRLSEVCAARS